MSLRGTQRHGGILQKTAPRVRTGLKMLPDSYGSFLTTYRNPAQICHRSISGWIARRLCLSNVAFWWEMRWPRLDRGWPRLTAASGLVLAMTANLTAAHGKWAFLAEKVWPRWPRWHMVEVCGMLRWPRWPRSSWMEKGVWPRSLVGKRVKVQLFRFSLSLVRWKMFRLCVYPVAVLAFFRALLGVLSGSFCFTYVVNNGWRGVTGVFSSSHLCVQAMWVCLPWSGRPSARSPIYLWAV